MNSRPVVLFLVVFVLAVTAAVLGLGTYPLWKDFFGSTSPTAADKDAPHAEPELVKLSLQAINNLGLKTQRLAIVPKYWRTLDVPAQVVERPGNCDRLVTAPMAGVVKQLFAVKGDLVHPGDKLLLLQITSEPLLTTQAALFKTQRDLELLDDEKKRLTKAFESGAIAVAKMIEVENQHKRLVAARDTYQHELAIRGLSAKEVQAIAKGEFLTEITIVAPPIVEVPKGPSAIARTKTTPPTPPSKGGENVGAPPFKGGENDASPPLEGGARGGEDHARHGYEVEDLKVLLGESVQQGQALCHLADHHLLFLEGRVFESESPVVQRAAREGWPIRAELPKDSAWPTFDEPLQIRFLANKIDPASQTVAFYVSVFNQHQEFQQGGKTFRLWRFRPGQRLRLHIPLEPFDDVFVLPAEAIAREGAETYVFRERGEALERKPVHVLYEDRQVAVLAHDGSVSVGNVIAANRAVQLNWALKASSGAPAGHHHHEH